MGRNLAMDLEGVVDLSQDSEHDLASARKSALNLIDNMVRIFLLDAAAVRSLFSFRISNPRLLLRPSLCTCAH